MIYLDHAATTPIPREVADAMYQVLAEEYANRIVRVKDGKIIDDTNPYVPGEAMDAAHKNMGHSAMSIFTAFGLSFNNLLTKKARTLLTAFAGSIGIIGIEPRILSLLFAASALISGILIPTSNINTIDIADDTLAPRFPPTWRFLIIIPNINAGNSTSI